MRKTTPFSSSGIPSSKNRRERCRNNFRSDAGVFGIPQRQSPPIVLEAKDLHLGGTNFDVRFENAQLALLLSTDQNKLRLTLLSGNTHPLVDLKIVTFNGASDQLLIDQDLALFDVSSLQFYNIDLQLEDKIMFQTGETLGFADFLLNQSSCRQCRALKSEASALQKQSSIKCLLHFTFKSIIFA